MLWNIIVGHSQDVGPPSRGRVRLRRRAARDRGSVGRVMILQRVFEHPLAATFQVCAAFDGNHAADGRLRRRRPASLDDSQPFVWIASRVRAIIEGLDLSHLINPNRRTQDADGRGTGLGRSCSRRKNLQYHRVVTRTDRRSINPAKHTIGHLSRATAGRVCNRAFRMALKCQCIVTEDRAAGCSNDGESGVARGLVYVFFSAVLRRGNLALQMSLHSN